MLWVESIDDNKWETILLVCVCAKMMMRCLKVKTMQIMYVEEILIYQREATSIKNITKTFPFFSRNTLSSAFNIWIPFSIVKFFVVTSRYEKYIPHVCGMRLVEGISIYNFITITIITFPVKMMLVNSIISTAISGSYLILIILDLIQNRCMSLFLNTICTLHLQCEAFYTLHSNDIYIFIHIAQCKWFSVTFFFASFCFNCVTIDKLNILYLLAGWCWFKFNDMFSGVFRLSKLNWMIFFFCFECKIYIWVREDNVQMNIFINIFKHVTRQLGTYTTP